MTGYATCADTGHDFSASKVVTEGAFGEVTYRQRYCTFCGQDQTVWVRQCSGVYDSRCGRFTMFRIEGVYPAAWNVDGTPTR